LYKGDTEGIVNYGLSIKYHYLLLFYRKKEEKLKSFRSQGGLMQINFTEIILMAADIAIAAGNQNCLWKKQSK
jgi:hypothetical protein